MRGALGPEENMPALARLALAAALLAALPAAAQRPPDPDKPREISLAVNQSVSVCQTGTVMCPATAPICDDPSVASMRDRGQGLEIVGHKKGKTLCSVMSTNQLRQVFSVTVR
jgi:hypothetical protein